MSKPELEFEIDEFGCIRYRVTDDGVLLSKDEKEFIIDYVTRMQADNAKLRELVRDYERCSVHADCGLCEYDGVMSTHCPLSPCFPDIDELRELGVEVNDG